MSDATSATLEDHKDARKADAYAPEEWPVSLTWPERIAHYNSVFPGRGSYLTWHTDGVRPWLSGGWILTNYARTKAARAAEFHGAYPGDILSRYLGLFPEQRPRLHLFSGMVDLKTMPGDTVDLNPRRNPTYCVDAQTLTGVPVETYGSVYCDPPYSAADAEKYGLPLPVAGRVMHALERLRPGAYVIWLDEQVPSYRKSAFAWEGLISLSTSTGHRVRAISIFRRISTAEAASIAEQSRKSRGKKRGPPRNGESRAASVSLTERNSLMDDVMPGAPEIQQGKPPKAKKGNGPIVEPEAVQPTVFIPASTRAGGSTAELSAQPLPGLAGGPSLPAEDEDFGTSPVDAATAEVPYDELENAVGTNVEGLGIGPIEETFLCRKPKRRGEFIRCHPDRSLWQSAYVLADEVGFDKQVYLVAPAVRAALLKHLSAALLVPCVNQDEEFFIWSIPIGDTLLGIKPSPSEKSARNAAATAIGTWRNVFWYRNQWVYPIADGNTFGDPVWPQGLTTRMINLRTFGDYFIRDLNHEIVKVYLGKARR